MDPITALSIAGNVVQFVDFGCKLVSASRQLYNNEELNVHAQAASAANDILDYTIKLRRTLRVPDGSAILTEDDLLLESICKGCDDVARDLLGRLDKLKVRSDKLEVPQKNKKGKVLWPTLTAAFQSVWTQEDLRDIQERLKQYRSQIDSRVIHSLRFIEQSERFDHLDAANKEIVTALVNRNASDDRGLQTQISALSTLLDRTEVVVKSQENSHKRVIIDIFQQLALASPKQKGNDFLAQARSTNQKIQQSSSTELLKSLRFPTITERFEAVDEAHTATFDWIFRPVETTSQYSEGRRWDDFSSWLESGKGLYWVNGKAGSGKSTLMKYIVNHSKTSGLLRRWAGTLKLCTGEFFFWNSGSKQQRSQAGLFRTLLYEILGQRPELIPTVLPARWGARYSAKCQARYCPPESWELSTLKIAFRTLISQTTVPLKLCLFIDGLDEYEGNDEEIAELFGKAAMSDNVKICCSSRPHQAFEDTFATRPGLRLQDLTFPDMRQYVHDNLEKNARMQQLSEEEPEGIKELIEEIGTAASGVFLWVRIVVLSLLSGLGKRDDIGYLQMRLRELPDELDDLYHHMIFKVDKVYQQETAELFQLVGTAFRYQNEEFLSWRETDQLSVLFLSFASERDTALVLDAKVGFITKQKILQRCKETEIRLRTRCGGLLEVQYVRQSIYTKTVLPDMTVSYLHRTVKDYLELQETRQKLADQTGGHQKDAFNASHAIFKAHILMLKAIDATTIVERPPRGLIEDTITWARRAERETQTSQPEFFDEFYNLISELWKSTHEHLFFQQQKSALTLATQCGLYHYLDAKLSEHSAITSSYHRGSRSLLDYALVPARETETFISVGVVATLLKHGAEPNRCETESHTSPWQNALSYLNGEVKSIGKRREYILNEWVPILKTLLESGANPYIGCPGPVRRVQNGRRKDRNEPFSPPDNVFARAFESDRRLLAEILPVLETAKLAWGRSTNSRREKQTGGRCLIQ